MNSDNKEEEAKVEEGGWTNNQSLASPSWDPKEAPYYE